MHSSLYPVFQSVSIFIRIIYYGILLFSIMSLFRPKNRFFLMLARFVSPFVMPFRRISLWIIRRTRIPIDFSCWLSIIALSILNQLWWQLYSFLSRLIL